MILFADYHDLYGHIHDHHHDRHHNGHDDDQHHHHHGHDDHDHIMITMVMMSIHWRYRGFSVCPGVPAGEESSLSLYTIVLICYRHCGHNHNVIIVIRASFIAHNVSLLSSPLPPSSPVLQSRGFKRCSMSDSLNKIPPWSDPHALPTDVMMSTLSLSLSLSLYLHWHAHLCLYPDLIFHLAHWCYDGNLAEYLAADAISGVSNREGISWTTSSQLYI